MAFTRVAWIETNPTIGLLKLVLFVLEVAFPFELRFVQQSENMCLANVHQAARSARAEASAEGFVFYLCILCGSFVSLLLSLLSFPLLPSGALLPFLGKGSPLNSTTKNGCLFVPMGHRASDSAPTTAGRLTKDEGSRQELGLTTYSSRTWVAQELLELKNSGSPNHN